MTTKRDPFLDEAGEQVVHFMGDVRTLGKLGELRGKIVEMAESGAWRRYKTALGVDEWRECEFDYFLIACDLAYDDVYRAIADIKGGDVVRAMMDQEANSDKRRTLEEAAASWHAPTPGTLVERAQRLGWTRSGTETLRVAPLSDRQRVKQRHGITREVREQKQRAKRIPVKKRRELDALAKSLWADLTDIRERRYLLDQLHKQAQLKSGRPIDKSASSRATKYRRKSLKMARNNETA